VRSLVPDVVDRDYAKTPLTRAEAERIASSTKDRRDLLNTRHKQVKASGWLENAPATSTLVEALLEDANVLRRPLVLRGSRGLVSRDEAEIRSFLEGA